MILSRFAGLAVVLAFVTVAVHAQTFNDVPIEKIDDAAIGGSATWADFNADGNMDLFLTGWTEPQSTASNGLISRFYRHLGLVGSLQGVQHRVFEHDLPTGVWLSDGAAGDVDADGDLDLFLCGSTTTEAPYQPFAALYELVDDRTFVERQAFSGWYGCSADWGDYDNDGDLDLVVLGATGPGEMATLLFENQDGTLVASSSSLPALGFGDVLWADADGDGDLDLAISGVSGDNVFVTDVLINDGGTFGPSGSPFQGVAYGSLQWGDYDNDGDLDLLVTGTTFGPTLVDPIATLYQNDGSGGFTDSGVAIQGTFGGQILLADLKNSGSLHILNAGSTASLRPVSQMLRNMGGSFISSSNECPIQTPSCSPFERVTLGSVTAFDLDNDFDLDLMFVGLVNGERFVQIERNGGVDIPAPDTPIVALNDRPNPPSGLTVAVETGGVRLSWDAATDVQTVAGMFTPSEGLSYNVRVGRTPGGIDVVPPMSIVGTGRRQLVAMGNAGPNRFMTLTLPSGTYYWSVQSVDHSYAGSQFSEEGSFTIP